MAELIFDVQLQERLAVSVMLAAASSPASILFQSNFVHPSQSPPDMSSIYWLHVWAHLYEILAYVLCIAVEWWGNIYSYFPQGYDFSLMLPVLSEGFSTPHLWQVKDEEKSWVEFSLSE